MKRFIYIAAFIIISAITLPAFANAYFHISNDTQNLIRIAGSGYHGNFYAQGLQNPKWSSNASVLPGETADTYSTTAWGGWEGVFSIYSSHSACYFSYSGGWMTHQVYLEAVDGDLDCKVSDINHNTFAISVSTATANNPA